MSENKTPTRRAFLKRGALLAAPLAAAAPAAVLADDGLDLKARLARLEDQAAIRELHQDWLRRVNAGAPGALKPLLPDSGGIALDQTVRSVAADHFGDPDAIDVAADGTSAAGRFRCIVETETAIPDDCTLAQMARAQGSGFIRRTERGALKVEYAKAFGAWTIAKAAFEAV